MEVIDHNLDPNNFYCDKYIYFPLVNHNLENN